MEGLFESAPFRFHFRRTQPTPRRIKIDAESIAPYDERIAALPANYPHGCTDEEIQTALADLAREVLTSGANINSVLQPVSHIAYHAACLRSGRLAA